MKTRKMGRTGLKVSAICLGTMTFGAQCDDATSRAIMDRAVDAGVDFFDTADVYPLPVSPETAGRTEEIIGRWLADTGRRDSIILATKCGMTMSPRPNDTGLSRKHIVDSIEGSLRRLRTDYIDLYQLHATDPQTPIEETLSALDDLVHSGKVRYIGCSNFDAWQLALALGTSERMRYARFDCIQSRYNLLYRDLEIEVLPLCRSEGVGVVCYNPLAAGLLSGKYHRGQAPEEGTRFTLASAGEMYRRRYWHDAQLEAVDSLRALLQGSGRALATAAIAWVLDQPGVTAAIVGASKPEQLAATLAAPEFELTDEERSELDGAWQSLPRRPHTPGYR
jgi:1-deoxyxylulose-5-phosphate synthase